MKLLITLSSLFFVLQVSVFSASPTLADEIKPNMNDSALARNTNHSETAAGDAVFGNCPDGACPEKVADNRIKNPAIIENTVLPALNTATPSMGINPSPVDTTH